MVSVFGWGLAWAQQPSVYQLSISPAVVSEASLPQTVTVTSRAVFPPGTSWDYTEVILETATASATNSAIWDTATAVGCPSGVAGDCIEFTYSLVFDSSFTAETYLPTVILNFFNTSGTYDSVWLNPTQLQAAGITASFIITGGTTPPPPPCTIPSVVDGTPSSEISDTTPPQLVGGACVSPLQVDVRAGDSTVTYTFRVDDDLSGFSYGYLELSAPNSSQFISQYFDSGTATSGGSYRGTYSVTAVIPEGATPGTWTARLLLYDSVGNSNFLDIPTVADPTTQAGFEVLSNPDSNLPSIASVTFNPTSVNVSAGEQVVTVDVRLTDVGRGIDLSRLYLSVDSATASPTRIARGGGFIQQVSGSLNDGVFRFEVRIPRHAPAGNWSLASLQVSDLAGNNAFFSRDFNGTGLPNTTFSVVSVPVDNGLPQVTSLSVTPTFVNTAIGSAALTVTATLSDNLAGILSFGCFLGYRSPSGQQFSFGGSLVRQSGTALSGVYTSTVTIPQFAEIGTWVPSSFFCQDSVGNYISVGTPDLLARWPGLLVGVIQPSNQTDGTVPPSTGVPTVISDAGSDVQLTFPPGAVSQPTTVSIDVLQTPINAGIPSGFLRGSGFVTIELNPKPVAPFAAPGVTVKIPLLNQLPAGLPLELYRVDPATGRAVPVPAVIPPGGFVGGFVDAGGLTATFTGVSGFSTVVALIPPGRPGDINGDDQVNCEDIRLIRNSWNRRRGQQGFDERADFNRDRVVNLLDLAGVSRFLNRRTRCQ